MINGIINVNKELGFTSFDVVAKLRGILKQKKIGHTGTLDPNACGVLPVCLGSGTKLVDMLTDKDKTYVTTMLLGTTTDTQDITGQVLEEKEVTCSEADVLAAISSFVGEYNQVPPMYSALKVDGKKLCDLARQGIEVERKARPVTIYDIKVLEVKLPRVRMEVSCSKGTYIRTLCDDIGKKLSCGACVETLCRTRAGSFYLKDAYTLSEIEAMMQDGTILEHVESVDAAFADLGKIVIRSDYDRFIANGNKFRKENIASKECGIHKDFKVYFSTGVFAGVYEYVEDTLEYKPVKMFLQGN